jgi:hypothetical protein
MYLWIVQSLIVISCLSRRFLLLYLLLLCLTKCFLALKLLFYQSELLLHSQELKVPLREAISNTRGRMLGRSPRRRCLPRVNHTIEDGIPSKKPKIKSKVSYITFTKIKNSQISSSIDFSASTRIKALGSMGVLCQSKPSPWILTASSLYFAYNFKHTIYVTTNISVNSIKVC